MSNNRKTLGSEATQVAQAVGDAAVGDTGAAELTAAEAEAAELAEVASVYEEAETGVQKVETAQATVEEGGPKYGGSLTVTLVANSSTLDPALATPTSTLAITDAVYDNLLYIQPDLSVKPELATSWEANDDFSSYTFHLRKGVKFHHGKEFKAEDVVFTVNRWLDPVLDSSIRPTFEVIEDIVVLDDYTIRFDLDAPNAFFPTYFSVFQARILPADVDVKRLAFEEFGSGPFILAEHEPAIRTVVVRNPDYWEEGKPYLDELIIQGIPEAAARDVALRNGDVDVIYELNLQSVSALENHPDTKVLNISTCSYIALPMRTDSPALRQQPGAKGDAGRHGPGIYQPSGVAGAGYSRFRPPHSPRPPRLCDRVCTSGLRPRPGQGAAGAGWVPGRDRHHSSYSRRRPRDDRTGGGL